MKQLIKFLGLLILIVIGINGVRGTSAQIILPPSGPDGCPADLDDEVDAAVDAFMATQNDKVPGMTIAITRDGELLCTKAYGFRDFENETPMRIDSRSHLGSVTKVLVATTMLHVLENDPAGINTTVYGNGGILDSPDYDDAILQGTRRHFPVLDMAIGANNRVITWYSDGKYTVGNSLDLDFHQSAQDFDFPFGQGPEDLIGIGRGGADNFVYSWYRDGTYSVGTPSDLSSVVSNRRENGDNFKSNGIHNIVGISIRPDGVIYAHYHDGTVTSGDIDTPWDLKSRWDGGTDTYVVPSDQDRTYDIVGMARSINGESIAWFSDDTRSKGTVTDLGADTGLEDFSRRGVTGSRQDRIAEYDDIQIRHLLTHSSGLTRSGNGDAAADKYATVPGFYNKETNPIPYRYTNQHVLSTRPLLFAPGTSYSYSNHGLGLIGHMIEEMTNEDWYDYMRENILIPAGAESITPRGTLYADLTLDSKPHKLNSDGEIVTEDYPIHNHSGSAAGSLKGSAKDLAIFMLATDRNNDTHPDVLLDGTLWLMETRPFPDTVTNRVLGWAIHCQSQSACTDNRRLSHDGLSTGEKGGAAFIAKYQNYRQTIDGVAEKVDDINVAIALNIGEGSAANDMSNLANDLAVIAHLDRPEPTPTPSPTATSELPIGQPPTATPTPQFPIDSNPTATPTPTQMPIGSEGGDVLIYLPIVTR